MLKSQDDQASQRSQSTSLSKAHLLKLPSMDDLPSSDDTSRRSFLKNGVSVVAGAAAFGIIRPRQTDAGILGWVTATVFAAGISWVVEKVLDSWISSDPKKLGLQKVARPEPARRNTLHNSFAEPWIITNSDYHISDRRVSGYNSVFGLQQFYRLTDLNSDEVAAIRWEFNVYGCALMPSGLRRKFSSYDRNTLDEAANLYKTEVDPASVQYVQHFIDNQQNEHSGFAVARGGKAQLLLV